jgi:hypothetical protein
MTSGGGDKQQYLNGGERGLLSRLRWLRTCCRCTVAVAGTASASVAGFRHALPPPLLRRRVPPPGQWNKVRPRCCHWFSFCATAHPSNRNHDGHTNEFSFLQLRLLECFRRVENPKLVLSLRSASRWRRIVWLRWERMTWTHESSILGPSLIYRKYGQTRMPMHLMACFCIGPKSPACQRPAHASPHAYATTWLRLVFKFTSKYGYTYVATRGKTIECSWKTMTEIIRIYLCL